MCNNSRKIPGESKSKIESFDTTRLYFIIEENFEMVDIVRINVIKVI